VIFLTPNMMATRVSPQLLTPLFRNVADLVAKRQEAGILDRYMEAAKALCREKNIPVCDCYEKWKLLRANGVDTTELLSNKQNHPTRDMHWLFAWMLVQQIIG
jgi:hypothetical protein